MRSLDERMVRRALALATLGTGTAAPNPRVGAVVSRGAEILGQGYHARPGGLHAEALALEQVERLGRSARGATLYTTLEPCCHTGRTGPCVERILRAGISRVVASMSDPNPKVDGRGFRTLRRNGVRVEVGLLRAEALRLNESFVKHTRTGIPLVTLKGAVTLDGRIAARSGDSRWVTDASARRHARLLRAEHEAVMVGSGTLLADDPRLDRRPPVPGAGPVLRVVLDSALRLSPESRLVSSLAKAPVLVFCAREVSPARRRTLERAGIEVEEVPRRAGGLDLLQILRSLGGRGITSVLVEGGGELHGSFLDLALADRLALYVAPKLLGGRAARPLAAGEGALEMKDAYRLRGARCSRVGSGWFLQGRLDRGRRAARNGP